MTTFNAGEWGHWQGIIPPYSPPVIYVPTVWLPYVMTTGSTDTVSVATWPEKPAKKRRYSRRVSR